MDLLTQLLWLLVLSLGLITSGICVFLFWAVPRLERRFVFQPSKEVAQTPSQFGVPFEQFFVPTPDGERLSAWHLLPNRPRAAVLYFHGNRGNLGLFAEVLARFYQNRLQVFAVDYRGYGASSGQPTEKGVYMDALAAVEYFQDRLRVDGCPVVFWGRSLGGPVAAYASGRALPGGVILETTFSSKRVLLRNYPWQFRFFSVFRDIALTPSGTCPGSTSPSSWSTVIRTARFRWSKGVTSSGIWRTLRVFWGSPEQITSIFTRWMRIATGGKF